MVSFEIFCLVNFCLVSFKSGAVVAAAWQQEGRKGGPESAGDYTAVVAKCHVVRQKPQPWVSSRARVPLPRPQAEVHSVRTRCNELNLEHGKFCLDKYELFHKGWGQKAKQGPREVEGPPSLDVIKNSLGKSLSDGLKLDLF